MSPKGEIVAYAKTLIISRGENGTTFLWAFCLNVVPDVFNILGNGRSIQISPKQSYLRKLCLSQELSKPQQRITWACKLNANSNREPNTKQRTNCSKFHMCIKWLMKIIYTWGNGGTKKINFPEVIQLVSGRDLTLPQDV